MEAVGILQYDLTADPSKLNREIDIAEKNLEKSGDIGGKSFSSKLSSGLGSAATAVFDFSKKAALAFGTAGIAVTGFAVNSAANLEQTRTAFNVMLKDTVKGGQLLTELKKFSAATPFEFPEIAQAGKSLLAFGFAAKDIQPTLTRLGDIASGIGMPIGELSELYGKARVQGRLFGEDINQLTGRGIPVTEALAKQFGTTTDNIKQMVADGKVGFPELEKALSSMTEKGGMFEGGMKSQSVTFSGLMSTMKDNVGDMLLSFVGVNQSGDIMENGLFAKIKGGLEGMGTDLSKNSEEITKWGAKIGDVFVTSLEKIVIFTEGSLVSLKKFQKESEPALNNFLTGASNLWKTISEYLGPSLIHLWETITTKLLPSLGRLWEAVSPILIPVLKVLGTILGGTLLFGINNAIIGLDAIITAMSSWYDFLSKTVEKVKELVGWINKISGGSLNKIADSVKGFFGGAFESISGRATGGEMNSGQPYLTGERGPELIIPSGNSKIYNAQDTARMMGGSAPQITLNVGSVDSDQRVRQIAAVVEEIIGRNQFRNSLGTA